MRESRELYYGQEWTVVGIEIIDIGPGRFSSQKYNRTTGGCEQGAHRLLKSLCQEYDRNQGRKSGVTKSILKGGISIDIQWGISFMLGRCRANHGSGDTGGGIISRFL